MSGEFTAHAFRRTCTFPGPGAGKSISSKTTLPMSSATAWQRTLRTRVVIAAGSVREHRRDCAARHDAYEIRAKLRRRMQVAVETFVVDLDFIDRFRSELRIQRVFEIDGAE